MRRLESLLAIIALAGVAYLVSFPAAFASRVHKASCGPSGAQTVVVDGAARVYQVPPGHGQRGRLYNYYGCAVAHAKSRLLARRASVLAGVRLFGCAGRGCRLVRTNRLAGATVGVIVERHGLDSIDSS